MAEEQAKGAGGLPAAIERCRLVTLPASRATVEVRRWSFIRAAEISRFINEVVVGLPEDVLLDVANSIGVFYKHGPEKMLEVARLSVAPEHRAAIGAETDYADVFAVLDAAFEINEAGGGLGKMSGLASRFLLGQLAAVQRGAETGTKPPPEPALAKASP